jgi:preprotein translocase subunit YajC
MFAAIGNWVLLAQDQPGGYWQLILMWAPLIFLGWFLLIRPAQRQERERRQMLALLKKNDRVIAAGGILGTVTNIKENREGANPTMEDEVTIRVDDNVRLRVLRSSIHRILSSDESRDPKETANP